MRYEQTNSREGEEVVCNTTRQCETYAWARGTRLSCAHGPSKSSSGIMFHALFYIISLWVVLLIVSVGDIIGDAMLRCVRRKKLIILLKMVSEAYRWECFVPGIHY